MILSDSSELALQICATYGAFCHGVMKYHDTDSQKYLTMAMRARAELINGGHFTAEFLDGVQQGMIQTRDKSFIG